MVSNLSDSLYDGVAENFDSNFAEFRETRVIAEVFNMIICGEHERLE